MIKSHVADFLFLEFPICIEIVSQKSLYMKVHNTKCFLIISDNAVYYIVNISKAHRNKNL